MAYERNWAFSFDNFANPASALEYCRWQMWAIKAMLLGQYGGFVSGLWTTYYSCDSVTAGTANDGVDRWGSTYDGTKIVRGTAAAARSWYVLKSPTMNGLNFYLTFSFDTANDYQTTIIMSKAAPTGGTTTARPTATDEWAPNAATGMNANASGLASVNMCLSDTGDFIYFSIRSGAPGGPYATTAVAVVAPVGCHASDGYPIWAYRWSGEGGLLDTAFNYQQMYSGLSGTATKSGSGAAAFQGIITMGSQVITGRIVDVLTGKRITLPVLFIVCNATGTAWHLRGRLPDVFVQPDSGGTATYPLPGTSIVDATGNVTHVLVGGVIYIPANRIPTIS